MCFSRVYIVNMVKGGSKSKKILFFIVLLFIIIQLVTIIGLAKEENATEPLSTGEETEVSEITEGNTIFSTFLGEILSINPLQDTTTGEKVKDENAPEKPAEITEDESGNEITNEEVTNEGVIEGPTSAKISDTTDNPTSDRVSKKDGRYAEIIPTSKPKLGINVSGEIISGDVFKVTVTSKDSPVEEATVTFIKDTVFTDVEGVALIKAPLLNGLNEEMELILKASKTGYVSSLKYISINPKEDKTIEYTPPYIAQPGGFFNLQSFQSTLNFPFLNRLGFQTDI